VVLHLLFFFYFFFFQAEDGIRDFHVTGVQTCALPISESSAALSVGRARPASLLPVVPICGRGPGAASGDPRPGSRVSPYGHRGQIGRASCRERVSISGCAEEGHKTSEEYERAGAEQGE